LNSIGKDINEFGEILDFGCGAGRQIQYFYDYKTSKITGCDPNADHIDGFRLTILWQVSM
jgi:SAM-dependent methyltransferase